MRIITGKAKGMRLQTLEGEATRPTTERVKEAIFSMIQFDIEGRDVLDLFSGSGQLGLEALSRGANSATLVDKAKAAIGIISQNAQKTRLDSSCKIICSDYLDFCRSVGGRAKYDIIFLDPPYAMKLVKPSLEAFLKYGLLKPYSLIVCESGDEDIFDGDETLADKFEIIKKVRYSAVYITMIKPREGVAL